MKALIEKMYEEACDEFYKSVPEPNFEDENFDTKAWFKKRDKAKARFYRVIKKRSIEIIMDEVLKQAEIKAKEMLNVNL